MQKKPYLSYFLSIALLLTPSPILLGTPFTHPSAIPSSPLSTELTTTLRSFLSTRGSEISLEEALVNLHPLKQSNSLSLSKLSILNKHYVIHVFDTQLPLEDRKREISVQTLASHHGLAPQVLYIEPSFQGYVTEFMDAPQGTFEACQSPDNIKQLGEFFQKLHSLNTEGIPVAQGHHVFVLQKLASMNHKNIVPLREDITSLSEKLSRLFEEHSPPQVVSHLDVFFHNFFFTPQGVKMIDWETGGISSAYYDLALLSVALGWNPQQEALFLNTYYGREPTQVEADLYEITKICSFLYVSSYFLNLSDVDLLDALLDDPIEALTLPSFNDLLLNYSSNHGTLIGISPETSALVLLKEALCQAASKKAQEAIARLTHIHPRNSI